MATTLPIEGGLANGDACMFMAQTGSSFSVLACYTGSGGTGNPPSLFFDESMMGNINNLNSSIQPAVFRLGASGNNALTFTGIVTPGGGDVKWGLSFISGSTGPNNTVEAGTAPVPQPLTAQQNTYATWPSPTLMLSGAGYSLLNASQQTLYFYTGTEDSTAPFGVNLNSDSSTWISQGLIVVPLQVVFGCMGGASGTNTNNCPGGACDQTVPLCSTYCGVLPDDPICATGPTGPTGPTGGACIIPNNLVQLPAWTNIGDCANQVTYQYCAAGKVCGTNCNGPCQNTGKACTYNSTSKGFGCNTASATSGDWWKKPWFWIMIVVIVVLFIILIGVALYSSGHHKKPASVTSTTHPATTATSTTHPATSTSSHPSTTTVHPATTSSTNYTIPAK